MGKCEIFNLSRFVKVCRKSIMEDWKVNVLRLASNYGILAILFIWNGYLEYGLISRGASFDEDPTWGFVATIFGIGLFISGAIAASNMMSKMAVKTGTINVLMTPASMLEKYLGRLIWVVVVATVSFLVAFYAADYTKYIIYKIIYPDIKVIMPIDLSAAVSLRYMSHKGAFVAFFILSYLYTQSLFVLGSNIWPKRSFVKTFAAGIIISIVYFWIGWLSSKIFINPEENYLVRNMMDMSEEQVRAIMIAIISVFTLFNWVLGYYRFKESEIIQRM